VLAVVVENVRKLKDRRVARKPIGHLEVLAERVPREPLVERMP